MSMHFEKEQKMLCGPCSSFKSTFSSTQHFHREVLKLYTEGTWPAFISTKTAQTAGVGLGGGYTAGWGLGFKRLFPPQRKQWNPVCGSPAPKTRGGGRGRPAPPCQSVRERGTFWKALLALPAPAYAALPWGPVGTAPAPGSSTQWESRRAPRGAHPLSPKPPPGAAGALPCSEAAATQSAGAASALPSGRPEPAFPSSSSISFLPPSPLRASHRAPPARCALQPAGRWPPAWREAAAPSPPSAPAMRPRRAAGAPGCVCAPPEG